MAQFEKARLGERGYHATIKDGTVDVRVYQRDFTKTDLLHPTWKGATLLKEEWFDLVSAAPAVTACLEAFQNDKTEPSLFVPLGHKGLHAVVNTFNDQVLIQLRIYSRSFYDPDKLFPTKQGATLKPDEWLALCENMKQISSALVG